MASTLKSPTPKPPITLILGPIKSGKTSWMLERFTKETLLIVPSRSELHRVQSALASRGKAFFSDGIHTFESISHKILSDYGIFPPIVDDARRLWLLRRILAGMEKNQELRFLKGVGDNAGYLNALADFVKELKHAEIFYTKLEEGLRRKGPDPKDAEILELFARYQKSLNERNAFDREGLLWQAKTLLERGATCAGQQRLMVDGFDSFTPTQLGFLRGLAATMEHTTLSLTMEKNSQRARIFTHCERTRTQLHEHFSIKEEWLTGGNRDIPPFSLSNGECVPISPRGRITLHEFPTLAAETNSCAAQIKRLLYENANNLAPKDIAVCVRHKKLFEAPLAAAFALHGLPFQANRLRRIAQTPVYHFLSALIRAHATQELQDLLIFLRSPMIAEGLRQKGLPAADWIARAFAESNITALSGDWKTRLRSAIKNRIPHHATDLDTLPEKFEHLIQDLSVWPAKQSAHAHRDSLIQCLSTWCVTQEEQPGQSDQWNAFWNMVDATTAFQAAWDSPPDGLSKDLTLAEWWQDMLPFAQETNVRETSGQEGIEILEAHEMRGASFRTVFLLGLNENIFPSVGVGPSLHTTAERRRMIEAGLDIQDKGDMEARRAQEAFLFHEVLSAAKEALYVSWHKSNPESKECLRSPFFMELEKLAPKETRVPLVGPDAWACPQDAFGAMALSLFGSRSSRSKYAGRFDPSRVEQLKRRASIERSRDRRMGFSVWDAQMKDAKLVAEIHNALGFGAITSASKLNEYASCPFRFFSRYALGIDPEKPFATEISRRQCGILLHEILWKLYHGHFQTQQHENVQTAFAAMKVDLPAIAAETFNTFEKEYGILRQGIWTWEKNRMLLQLQIFLNRDQMELQKSPARSPSFFELAFGMPGNGDGSDPSSQSQPVRLSDGAHALKLRGKIDRVDMEQFTGVDGKPKTGFWVLDYKSGPQSASRPDIAKGKKLQLPLYLLSAEQVLEKGGNHAFPAGATLLTTWPYKMQKNFCKDKKGLAAGRWDDPEWEEILEQSRAWVFRHAQGISEGRFTPTPSCGKCVTDCAYRSVCRFDERRIEHKLGAQQQTTSEEPEDD